MVTKLGLFWLLISVWLTVASNPSSYHYGGRRLHPEVLLEGTQFASIVEQYAIFKSSKLLTGDTFWFNDDAAQQQYNLALRVYDILDLLIRAPGYTEPRSIYQDHTKAEGLACPETGSVEHFWDLR
jgi:hypothetical protein